MKRIREAMFEPRPRADAAFDAAVWHDLMRATVELPASLAEHCCAPAALARLPRALLDRRADDAHGDTLLAAAARHGRRAAVERLLAAGAAVDAANSTGATPFLLAVRV